MTTSPASGPTAVVDRNVRTLFEREARDTAHAAWHDRLADAVTRFTGSMTFVTIHLIVFGAWIVVNLGYVPGIPRWDESFVMLAMSASVEAIFLSTFVLISQNRMAAVADKRAQLDLQISLLTEHEITRLAGVVGDIARRIGVDPPRELSEVERDVAPEAVLDRIESERR